MRRPTTTPLRARHRWAMERARACLVLLLASALGGHAGALCAEGELKASVAVGTALPLGKAAQRWTEHLRAEGVGGIASKLHPGASLAERDPARELLALKEGRADLAVGSALQWSLQVPALGVFALPWIAPRDAELAALAGDARVTGLLAARMAAAGVRLVALAPLGYRAIANSVRPIGKPEDVAGLRLRATPSPMLQDVLRALGALPQSMPFREAQAAFANGALDGLEGLPTALAASRAVASGQRHVTDLGGIGDAMVFGVREGVWSAWSGEQQARARTAAQQAIADVDALAAEQAALRQLAGRGAAVMRLTPAGHEAFRAAAQDADTRWRAVVGSDVVAAAEQAVASAAAPTTRAVGWAPQAPPADARADGDGAGTAGTPAGAGDGGATTAVPPAAAQPGPASQRP